MPLGLSKIANEYFRNENDNEKSVENSRLFLKIPLEDLRIYFRKEFHFRSKTKIGRRITYIQGLKSGLELEVRIGNRSLELEWLDPRIRVGISRVGA